MLWLLLFFIIALGIERLAHSALSTRPWNTRDTLANLATTVAYYAVDATVRSVLPLAVLAWVYRSARVLELGNTWWEWVFVFVLQDFSWYLDHRLAHRVGLLWAMHHVHHSSREFNLSVASRGFVLDDALARPTFYLLPILGVSPEKLVVLRVVVSVWGLVQHTRLVPRLGLLDRWLATPSNHRVHHGCDPAYIDRNFGQVLLVWDRLFHTWCPETHEPHYGIANTRESDNPLRHQVAGLVSLWQRMASAERWSDKLRYVVMPPEWEHEGKAGASKRTTPK